MTRPGRSRTSRAARQAREATTPLEGTRGAAVWPAADQRVRAGVATAVRGAPSCGVVPAIRSARVDVPCTRG